jgi:hypothetical protein
MGFPSPFLNIPQQIIPTFSSQPQKYMGGPAG